MIHVKDRQYHTWYRPVFLEPLLGFRVSSGELLDTAVCVPELFHSLHGRRRL